MPVPRFTTLSLIVRFLLKKVIVYILVLAIVAVFGTNPLTYGIPWLLMALLVWCILDAAALYGDVWAYADLKEALAKGRDPETLVEAWQRRDAGLQKFDGVVLAILGVGVILMGYSKWLGALGVIFGLAKLIPFISEVDPRDIEKWSSCAKWADSICPFCQSTKEKDQSPETFQTKPASKPLAAWAIEIDEPPLFVAVFIIVPSQHSSVTRD